MIERVSSLADLGPEPDQHQVSAGYLRSPPLVGRGSVISDVRRCLTDALAGRGRSVMIEGSSGQGRSALLEQIGIDAQLAGANVLRFQPSGRRDAGLALALLHWMRAVFPALWSEQRKQHPMLLRDTVEPLRRLNSVNDESDQRAKLVTATLACVEQMSREAPLVLLIDDVQRADPASLALIGSIARVVSGARVLLVTGHETGSVGSDANVLSDLRATAKLFVLKPLAESDLLQLVEVVFGKVPNTLRLARFLQEKSAGNPGQCMNLCRHLLQQGEIRYERGRFSLPFDPRAELSDAQGLALTRVNGLSEPALALLRVLCVAESALTPAQAGAALGVDAAALVGLSEELQARDLVRLRDE
ncbi:MAG TPA: AAA family ATPase, partial [Polyangiales bacterium]